MRSVDECIAEAEADVTVATSLLERRAIVGAPGNPLALDQRWQQAFDVDHFVKAKRFEQQQRYARFEDTAYNLEPNIKESPGGLRDVQMVLWLSRAITGAIPESLVSQGLNRPECDALSTPIARPSSCGLGCICWRNGARTAWYSNCRNAGTNARHRAGGGLRASEMLMKRYYQAARQLRLFNDILIDALTSNRSAPKTPLPGSRFAACDGKLDPRKSRGQSHCAGDPAGVPPALSGSRLHQFHARTAAGDCARSASAENAFDNDECRSLCVNFLRGGHGVYHALKAMNSSACSASWCHRGNALWGRCSTICFTSTR